MRFISYVALIFVTCFAPISVHAESLLRVACAGDDAGAEVYIGGKFRGECPVDIQASAGVLQLRAVKIVDAQHERVFEQDVRIGEGTIKKVEAVLSEPRLNAAAQKLEDERMRVARAEASKREAEERRRDGVLLAQQQAAASAGDTAAMVALGDRYEDGIGVEKSEVEASGWYLKARDAGNELAAFKWSNNYKIGKKQGKNQEMDEIVKILSLPIEKQRDVMIDGANNVRSFIESDSFFVSTGGNQKITYSYPNVIGTNATGACNRDGKFVRTENRVEYNGHVSESAGISALGGVIPVQFDNGRLIALKTLALAKISSVYGQPFPLVFGKRFGLNFETEHWGYVDFVKSHVLSCAVENRSETSAAQAANITCVDRIGAAYVVVHYHWNDAAGCFSQLDEKLYMPN